MLDSSGVTSNKGRMAYWKRSSGWINNIYKCLVLLLLLLFFFFVHVNSRFFLCGQCHLISPGVFFFSFGRKKVIEACFREESS